MLRVEASPEGEEKLDRFYKKKKKEFPQILRLNSPS